MEKKRFKAVLGKVAYVLDCVLLAAVLVIAVAVLVETFKMETRSLARIGYHNFEAYGFLAFFLLFLIPRLRKNTQWMMSFTHEFTHLIFALLFFRKIHRFKVDDKDSHVSYSSGWFGYIPITLAPYCVPIFTLALFPWHYTTDANVFLYAIQVLLGFSFAFHTCCWAKQIRLHQTDITGPGAIRSLLFIAIFQILFFCLIVLTPSSGVPNALSRVFWDFPSKFVSGLFSL